MLVSAIWEGSPTPDAYTHRIQMESIGISGYSGQIYRTTMGTDKK